MTVRRTYQYKLYNSKQNKHLVRAIEIAAEIWNHCIALHRRYYRMYGKSLSANKLKVHLTKLKKLPKYAHWNELGSQAVQDVVERIARAYEAFFDHVKKKRHGRKSPPKFRKKKNYYSFTLKQAGYKFLDGNKIQIMGHTYKFAKHRPFWGDIKTLTVKRTKLGEFFLFLSVVQELPDTEARTGDAVGFDFGLKSFLTADDGKKIDSPQWYLSSLDDIRKAHRAVSLCQRGSNNRKRALLNLERTYKRVVNRRRDWFFKLANELTEKYSVICLEDLNLDAMKRLWGRKVSDLGFAEFVSILEWCALKNQSQIVRIDRWAPSSKACHICGTINPGLGLKDRFWTCQCCGTHHDRDINAAVNIRNLGFSLLYA